MNEFITQFETNEGNKKYDFQSLGNFPKAQIGQFLKVTAVDENGNPTAWEMAEALNTDMSNLDKAADLSALVSALGASQVVTGTYTGTKSNSVSTEQFISLGFTPKCVIVQRVNYQNDSGGSYRTSLYTSFVATDNAPVYIMNDSNRALEIVNNGFNVRNVRPNENYYIYLNNADVVFSYVAVA